MSPSPCWGGVAAVVRLFGWSTARQLARRNAPVHCERTQRALNGQCGGFCERRFLKRDFAVRSRCGTISWILRATAPGWLSNATAGSTMRGWCWPDEIDRSRGISRAALLEQRHSRQSGRNALRHRISVARPSPPPGLPHQGGGVRMAA